jgi:hypothetical protein
MLLALLHGRNHKLSGERAEQGLEYVQMHALDMEFTSTVGTKCSYTLLQEHLLDVYDVPGNQLACTECSMLHAKCSSSTVLC